MSSQDRQKTCQITVKKVIGKDFETSMIRYSKLFTQVLIVNIFLNTYTTWSEHCWHLAIAFEVPHKSHGVELAVNVRRWSLEDDCIPFKTLICVDLKGGGPISSYSDSWI